jgi:hypothetical protein
MLGCDDEGTIWIILAAAATLAVYYVAIVVDFHTGARALAGLVLFFGSAIAIRSRFWSSEERDDKD